MRALSPAVTAAGWDTYLAVCDVGENGKAGGAVDGVRVADLVRSGAMWSGLTDAQAWRFVEAISPRFWWGMRALSMWVARTRAPHIHWVCMYGHTRRAAVNKLHTRWFSATPAPCQYGMPTSSFRPSERLTTHHAEIGSGNPWRVLSAVIAAVTAKSVNADGKLVTSPTAYFRHRDYAALSFAKYGMYTCVADELAAVGKLVTAYAKGASPPPADSRELVRTVTAANADVCPVTAAMFARRRTGARLYRWLFGRTDQLLYNLQREAAAAAAVTPAG